MTAPLRCPKCKSDGLTILATVWSLEESVVQFIDENNNPHIHDPKTFQRTYRCASCSNEFMRSGRVPCPNCSYPKGSKDDEPSGSKTKTAKTKTG